MFKSITLATCGSTEKFPRNFWCAKNLGFCAYDLPSAWRLIYTIESDEIKIVSIILEWFDHKDYEKKFNY